MTIIRAIKRVSGDYIEVTQYEQPRVRLDSPRTSPRRPTQRASRTQSNNYEQNMANNRKLAKKKVRCLIECNFPERYSFVTLTFKDDVTNLDEANRRFKRFTERLRYTLKKEHHEPLRYIQVTELHEQRNNVIHFHLVTNFITREDTDLLKTYWKQEGYLDIGIMESTADNNACITTYMLKKAYDPRLPLKNLYNTSRNLVKPITEEFETVAEAFDDMEGSVLLNSIEFEVPGQGTMKYSQFYN